MRPKLELAGQVFLKIVGHKNAVYYLTFQLQLYCNWIALRCFSYGQRM